MPWIAERISISKEESIIYYYCIAGMQNKSLIYLFFLNIRQFLCPKNTFSPIYIGIKSIKEIKVMTEKMLKFVKLNLQTPKKREAKKRVDDFNEIYD